MGEGFTFFRPNDGLRHPNTTQSYRKQIHRIVNQPVVSNRTNNKDEDKEVEIVSDKFGNSFQTDTMRVRAKYMPMNTLMEQGTFNY